MTPSLYGSLWKDTAGEDSSMQLPVTRTGSSMEMFERCHHGEEAL